VAVKRATASGASHETAVSEAADSEGGGSGGFGEGAGAGVVNWRARVGGQSVAQAGAPAAAR
jgi:hypothetical protein